MSGTVLHDGDVVVRAERALRRITLNRPKALNAITLDMAVTMTGLLRSWASDPAVGAILLDGAGERAFCAGGDIRALYDAAKASNPLPAQFWSTEYKLNVLIARYPKPLIVIMDGVVMGGGVGLASHAAHRVVTERSAVAMPEVGIGFFPDVGVSYLLAGAPGRSGRHLALTGARIGPADAIYCGLADIHIPVARLAEIPGALADCRASHDVRTRLDELAMPPAPAGCTPRGHGSIAATARTMLKGSSQAWATARPTRRVRRSRRCKKLPQLHSRSHCKTFARQHLSNALRNAL